MSLHIWPDTLGTCQLIYHKRQQTAVFLNLKNIFVFLSELAYRCSNFLFVGVDSETLRNTGDPDALINCGCGLREEDGLMLQVCTVIILLG